ncbi:VOC family protein [Subtercola lobariae]|uniref:Catechol 2,3-dioxygenase n=1 Tax=Subtercola lobariae TaxID=1588641 RepID=A0A917B8K2_9MICO|nr:VOC family protein [Subtercola lobariae]GGF30486.1 catechol 2,3-dioxygenase [Subtercola lobariae]
MTVTTPLLAQIAYLEITSPNVEESVAFYTEKFGLRVVDRLDGKAYLRCWGDYYRYSLVISEGPDAALATMAWRTHSDSALEALVESVEATGTTGTWSESGHAHGRAYEFVGPYGHSMTLLWEIDGYEAEPGFESIYPDRPERRSSHSAAPRFLDHVTVAASDVSGFAAWYADTLGFRIMANTLLDEAPINVFSVLTTNEKSHDLGVVLDTSTTAGRVHHIAFWADHPEDLVRGADVLLENGTSIEYGPSIHGIGEQNYLYFREPSSLRVELNSGGYRNYVPDWKANNWKPSLGSNNLFRNWAMPDSMMQSFPAADGGLTATEDGAPPALAEALLNPFATAAARGESVESAAH